MTGFTDAELTAILPNLRLNARNYVPAQGVEDLVQDTVVRMMEARGLFHAGTNLQAWAYVIMRNLFRNAYRKRNWRNAAIFPVDDTVTIRPDMAIDLRRVMDGIATLTPGQAEALRLVSIDGLEFHEAATVSGVPIGTTKSRWHRGREVLQKRFGDVI